MKVRTACFYGIVFFTAGICLSGCSSKQDESCLTIKKSGAVSQRIVEDFKEENYDLEGLRAMAEEEIDDFGQPEGESVELTQLKENGGKLTMVLDYSSVGAYNQFNETAMFSGSVEEAAAKAEKGWFTQEKMIKAKDKSEVNTKDILKETSLMTVILEDMKEPVLLELEKKILYYSENMELVSDKCARLKDAESGTGYVIYKK